MKKLDGKIALVTGSGRGIGRGCALELARAGAKIIINDRPGKTDAQETMIMIRNLGQDSILLEADIFSRSECETLVTRAISQFGRIDILVSNPAYNVRQPFLDYEPALFEKVIQGTLTSGFHMSQLVARHMVERGSGGKIVFISSVHALVPYPRSVAYNAAKAGLNHLARTIAVELSPQRINVNIIEPGWIDTPGEHETFGTPFMNEKGGQLPWGRFGTPSDIGQAAVFLASSDADYLTGSILRVDGGLVYKDLLEDIA